MLTENDIRDYLQLRTETKSFDVKEVVHWLTNRDEKLGLVKDILAMSNTSDGGVLLIGVRDGTYEFVGIAPEVAEEFDQTRVNDVVRKYADPPVTCQVHRFTIDGKRLVAIEVHEFPVMPTICKCDAGHTNGRELILKRATLYIRTDKATTEAVSNAEDLRGLIERSIRRRGDELLGSIRALLQGKPINSTTNDLQRYQEETESMQAFVQQNVGDALTARGHYILRAWPTNYESNRIEKQTEIARQLRETQTTLRGWPFPDLDGDHSANFEDGRQSYTIWQDKVEAMRAFRSGHFEWSGVFWEDFEGVKGIPGPGQVLEVVESIYILTEMFTFLERYYGSLLPLRAFITR
jgi:hypothetical protein